MTALSYCPPLTLALGILISIGLAISSSVATAARPSGLTHGLACLSKSHTPSVVNNTMHHRSRFRETGYPMTEAQWREIGLSVWDKKKPVGKDQNGVPVYSPCNTWKPHKKR